MAQIGRGKQAGLVRLMWTKDPQIEDTYHFNVGNLNATVEKVDHVTESATWAYSLRDNTGHRVLDHGYDSRTQRLDVDTLMPQDVVTKSQALAAGSAYLISDFIDLLGGW